MLDPSQPADPPPGGDVAAVREPPPCPEPVPEVVRPYLHDLGV